MRGASEAIAGRTRAVIRLVVLGVLLAGYAGVGTASAELEVTAARGGAPKVGSKLADDSVIDLPAGAEVRLLKHPGTETFVVNGPFKGTLKQYVERCKGAFSWFSSDCGSKSKTDQLPTGGTRGISR